MIFIFRSNQWRCSEKFRKFHRKTTVLESLFNKVAGLKACNFIEKGPQYRCSPVKFAKFLRTSILKNIPRATASVYFQVLQHMQQLIYLHLLNFRISLITILYSIYKSIYLWQLLKNYHNLLRKTTLAFSVVTNSTLNKISTLTDEIRSK